MIAALLHDVLDDTPTTPEALSAAFGPTVTAMVVSVSKLSAVNQMLRRDKRKVRAAAAAEDVYTLCSSLCLSLSLARPLSHIHTQYTCKHLCGSSFSSSHTLLAPLPTTKPHMLLLLLLSPVVCFCCYRALSAATSRSGSPSGGGSNA